MGILTLFSVLFFSLTAYSQTADVSQQLIDRQLQSAAQEFHLSASDLAGVYVARQYRTDHNGVTHLLFRQKYDGVDVENAVWVVNIDREGNVLNSGGTLYSRPDGAMLPEPDAEPVSAIEAVRAATLAVNPALGKRYLPFQSGASRSDKLLRFAQAEFGAEIVSRPAWYGFRGKAVPAWRVTVVDADGIHTKAVYVENRTRTVLGLHDQVFFQNPQPARGLVFERGSPQPNPNPGLPMQELPPLVERTLQPFTGDPVASPAGWVRAGETSGNNVTAGTNAEAYFCIAGSENCPRRPNPAQAANRDFSFPLELGPGAPNPTAFSDAVTTNMFYWVNRAHDFFYSIGFNEAAGNFQEDNFGRGGTGGDSVYAYAQYGIEAPGAASLNNANFGTPPEGTHPYMRMYVGTLGSYFTDAGLDADIIVHEYTHGVTHRLTQDLYATTQGAAMGEAWSDFFALEFLMPEGTPVDGVFGQGQYYFQSPAAAGRTHLFTTSMDVNPLTYANLGRVISGPEVHADGEIWVEAMVEVRAALIRQFGEKEGRRRARLIAIDSLKLSIPAPSMVDARDAVLLADRVDFQGAGQDQIWAAFARRGLGVLAQSGDGDSVHIAASFEVPSKEAAIGFYEDSYAIGESVRVVLQDANLTAPSAVIQMITGAGDIENFELRRNGSVYKGTIPSFYAPTAQNDGALELTPGSDIRVFYNDPDTGNGPKQITKSVPTYPDFTQALSGPVPFTFTSETPLFLRAPNASSLVRVLPFEFPYFGKKYSTVRVYNNGILTFESVDFTPCSDRASLSKLIAVAPMWMKLRTDGVAQSGEDVYVSQTADTVTFRWAAEIVHDFSSGIFVAPPDPVNFAVTLYRDGEIQFRYGSGNRNLVSGSQSLGCPAGAPTIGLSNGHETFTELSAVYDSKGTLENAPPLFFEPSHPYGWRGQPRGILDRPAAGESVGTLLTGSGVAYDIDASSPIRRVDVLVDGVAVTTASLGVNRADFCRNTAVPGCPNVGFTFGLSTVRQNLKPGTHTIQLLATNLRGLYSSFPETPVSFTVKEGDDAVPLAKIESPSEGATLTARATVSGYFALPDAQLLNLDVIVDGINYGAATYGLTRTDACATLPAATPGCPRIGFNFSLNTAAQNPGDLFLKNGQHSLQVRARDQYGRFVLFPATPLTIHVDNPVNQFPVVSITSPTPNQQVGGTLTVSGYAYDPDGKISLVSFVVDNASAPGGATVRYGAARPEVCANLPDVTACPNIGFDVDLDTKRLVNGAHSLRIAFIDDKGALSWAPQAFGGITFFVQN